MIAQPPKKPFKKKVNRDKLLVPLEKSIAKNEPMVPKYFRHIHLYIKSIFNNILESRDEVCELLINLIAGLRLEIIPINNIKYYFEHPDNPDIVVFEEENKQGEYYAVISITDLNEDGLILANERQMEFLVEQIHRGRDPRNITDGSLPPLRTGETALEIPDRAIIQTPKNQPSSALKRFKKDVSHQKFQSDINQEKSFDTMFTYESGDQPFGDSTDQLPSELGASQVNPFDTENKVRTVQQKSKVQNDREYNNLKTHNEKLKKELEEIYTDLDVVERKVKTSESLNGLLQNKINQLTNENQQYKAQIQKGFSDPSAEKKLTTLINQNNILRTQMQDVSQKMHELEEIVDTNDGELEFLKDKHKKFKKQLQHQANIALSKNKELDEIIEKIMLQKDNLSRSAMLFINENQLLKEALKKRDVEIIDINDEMSEILDTRDVNMEEQDELDRLLQEQLTLLQQENRKLKKKLKNV